MNSIQIRQTVRKVPPPRPARWVILAAWFVGIAVIAIGVLFATHV